MAWFYTLIAFLLQTTHAQLGLSIVPNPDRVIAYINNDFAIQKFEARSNDPDAIYTWTAASAHTTPPTQHYEASFFKAIEGYVIECTGTSNTFGTETTQVTIEAVVHGTFFDANDNQNGLISLSDTNFTVDYLKENASGQRVYKSEHISFNARFDRSQDLKFNWILVDADSGSQVAEEFSTIGGPLTPGTFEYVTVTDDSTDSKEVTASLPDSLMSVLTSGSAGSYQLTLDVTSHSIGTFDYQIGNYEYESWSFSGTFEFGAIKRNKNINPDDYEFTITWSLTGEVTEEFTFANRNFFEYNWIASGTYNLYYDIAIPLMNTEYSNLLSPIVVLESTFYFSIPG